MMIEVRLERFSEAQLKDFYLRCSRAAGERRMSGGEIAICSIGYELLLKRAFHGDFDALVAWSRRQDEAAQTGDPR